MIFFVIAGHLKGDPTIETGSYLPRPKKTGLNGSFQIICSKFSSLQCDLNDLQMSQCRIDRPESPVALIIS